MYDRPHYLLSFGGTVLHGAEIWQTGLRFAPMAVTPLDTLVATLPNIDMGDVFDDLAAVIGNNGNGTTYADHVEAKWAKLAVIKTDGHYGAAPSIAEGLVKGTQTGVPADPPQCAIVVSMYTGASFGTAQKGRMYWPGPRQMVASLSTTTGQIDATFVTGFRDLVIAAIDNANGEVSTLAVPTLPAVMSISGGVAAPQAPGTTRFITEMSVGRVVDTQRRRRSALQEAHVPAESRHGRAVREEREAAQRAPS